MNGAAFCAFRSPSSCRRWCTSVFPVGGVAFGGALSSSVASCVGRGRGARRLIDPQQIQNPPAHLWHVCIRMCFGGGPGASIKMQLRKSTICMGGRWHALTCLVACLNLFALCRFDILWLLLDEPDVDNDRCGVQAICLRSVLSCVRLWQTKMGCAPESASLYIFLIWGGPGPYFDASPGGVWRRLCGFEGVPALFCARFLRV